MILKNKRQATRNKVQGTGWSNLRLLVACALVLVTFNYATCKYGFKDIGGLPIEVKTFRVNYFENKAEYKNPQLSPQITEKLKQKIITHVSDFRDCNYEDVGPT